MTKERLILLDTILSEGNVDIGRLIAREIYTCITKKKGFLFFPCLITELCMKAAVPIYENEHTKFLSNNLNAEMRGKLKKEKKPMPQPVPKPKPMPKPMPQPQPMPKPMPAMQEIFMQKQAAVWKFQKEQHDWLQLVLHYMSMELGNIEAPVFPSWVLRTPGQEEKEQEDKDESEEEEEGTDKEVEEEEEQKLKKKVARKQAKGKKKVVTEPELEETYDSEKEDEEFEKEMDEDSEEEEEETDEVSSEEEEIARGVILEEIAKQRYSKTPATTQQETTYTSPAKSPVKTPTETPISSPTKEQTPSLKSSPIQPQKSPPHSTPPPSPSKTEQQSPSHITAQVISELMQAREEEGLEKEGKSEAVDEPEAETDAPASGASASQKATTTEHDEATIKLVLEAMARKKKEELGNTQKFFKTPALKKQAAKRKISEEKSTDVPASVPAATTEEIGASAPTEETPTKPSKEKKLKVKHTAPTRQSPRTRSGAKK